MNKVGTYWNDSKIDIIEINGKKYALYGWNGEKFTDCWQVADKSGYEPISIDTRYIIEPIYDWENCPKDEDGDYNTDELKQIGWEIA